MCYIDKECALHKCINNRREDQAHKLHGLNRKRQNYQEVLNPQETLLGAGRED